MTPQQENERIVEVLRHIGVEDHIPAIVRLVAKERHISYQQGREDALEEAAKAIEKENSRLSVNELIPFEQAEPFKRLTNLFAAKIRSLSQPPIDKGQEVKTQSK